MGDGGNEVVWLGWIGLTMRGDEELQGGAARPGGCVCEPVWVFANSLAKSTSLHECI